MATSKQLYSYILFLLLAGWTVQILAVQITGDPYSEDAQIWLAGTMLTPLVVTLFFLKANKNLRGQFLWKPNSKIFLISFVALLIPILIGFIILLTLQLLDLGKSEWFVFSNSEVTIQGGPFFLRKRASILASVCHQYTAHRSGILLIERSDCHRRRICLARLIATFDY